MMLSCNPVVFSPPNMMTASNLSLFATGVPLASSHSLKRGSEELFERAPGAVVSNGNAIGVHNLADNNNDAKKAKLDRSSFGKPSKVIHIRNIPTEVSEGEIIHLGIPFGRVTNVLVLKGKNQAFLEMADESAASTMVDYFSGCTAQLRGRAVYVQFSNHKELKTDQTHSNSNATAQAALQAAQALTGQSDTQGGPNTVLRVIVEHMIYPITLDVIHQVYYDVDRLFIMASSLQFSTLPLFHTASLVERQNRLDVYSRSTKVDRLVGLVNRPKCGCTLRQEVRRMQSVAENNEMIFSRFGNVLKIVTFTKNSSFQVLIQYPDVVSAQSAKLSLDGQSIYNSCCTLRIEFSKLTSLNVKYNNDKSRDYTNPTLPNGDIGSLDSLPLTDQLLPQLLLGHAPAAALQAARRSISNSDRLGITLDGLCIPSLINSLSNGGNHVGLSYPGNISGALPLSGFSLPGVPSGLRLPGHLVGAGQSCVLLISNLNEEMVSPDALFTLFGVYGDVIRVKILYNKKDCALIQMAEPQQAQHAMVHMDKLRLFGKDIRVMQSKYQTVQLPKEGQPDAGLTKDYTSSPLHRFKKPGSKNYQNIYSPSSTLHLSNIPPTTTEEELKSAFTTNGFEVKDFRFFPKDHRMALLQLESLDEAVAALIKMHNYRLAEQSHLRVSFSKLNIKPENN